MNRRNAIKNIGIGAGITVGAGTLATLFSSCQEELSAPADSWTPAYLSKEDATLLDELSDIILPPTDTPGAKEAKVVRYMDQIVKNLYKPKKQKAFQLGVQGFKNKFQREQKVEVSKASRKQLTNFLKTNMAEVSEERLGEIMQIVQGEAPDPKAEGAANEPYYFYQFLRSLRNLTIAGYFGSELIAENHLNYLPVPGPYQGCIPLEDTGGKAWAL